MSASEWRTLAIFVAVIIAVAQFSPQAAFGLTIISAVIILLKSNVLSQVTGGTTQ